MSPITVDMDLRHGTNRTGGNRIRIVDHLDQSNAIADFQASDLRLAIAPTNSDGTTKLVNYAAWQSEEMGRGE